MTDGVSEKGKEVFLSYKNDDDAVISGFVILLEMNDFVRFQTNQNIITIPSNRILKIKERLQ